ncbi:hypothetical protein [Paenibacillus rhizophilus]|nr:hypothetical protein [Paenibacillus rhizophilus]
MNRQWQKHEQLAEEQVAEESVHSIAKAQAEYEKLMRFFYFEKYFQGEIQYFSNYIYLLHCISCFIIDRDGNHRKEHPCHEKQHP